MGTPRVFLASEMGGGWGHLLPLRAIARELEQLGASVKFLACDATKARDLFSELRTEIVALPAWTIRKSGFSLNYAHCVWGNGYWDEKRFLANLGWWRERIRTLRPSFLLADFAPTALLAALVEGLPRGAIGTGFTLPPPLVPMPGLHPWLNLGDDVLTGAESLPVAVIRKIIPDFHAMADLFSGARRFLAVFPELDHFPQRPKEVYWGPVLEVAKGRTEQWPTAKGPKVFFYLSANNRCLGELVAHLRRLGVPAIGHIRGLAESRRRELESANVRILPALVDLFQVAHEADFAVTQGGLHTSAAMLLAGIPLLVCPEQLEQMLLAFRLNQRGLCEWLSPWTDPGRLPERIDRLLSSAELARRVAGFAGKYAGYDSTATSRKVAQACLESMA